MVWQFQSKKGRLRSSHHKNSILPEGLRLGQGGGRANSMEASVKETLWFLWRDSALRGHFLSLKESQLLVASFVIPLSCGKLSAASTCQPPLLLVRDAVEVRRCLSIRSSMPGRDKDYVVSLCLWEPSPRQHLLSLPCHREVQTSLPFWLSGARWLQKTLFSSGTSIIPVLELPAPSGCRIGSVESNRPQTNFR